MSWQNIWKSISSVCVNIAFKFLGAIIVLIIGKAVIAFIVKHFPKGSQKHPLDPTARNFLKNIVKTTLYIITGIIIVGILGVPMASVIAVIGSAGAAIALALQGSLSNFASGIMLLIVKPLKLGDYIETANVAGTVTDLGMFYTTLVTPDNKHITVPNSALTGGTITNYSREKTRRLDIVFSVDYSTDIESAKKIVFGVVKKHPMVLSNPAPFARITELDSSAINLTVRVWCPSENYWDVKFDLTENIKAAFDQNGISIPFPQLDVHVKDKED